MPRELYGVQSLRGIAALMVVADHMLGFHRNFYLPGGLSVGEAGVDLFFVISGFIMMYVTPGAFRGWRDQAAFLIRRWCRIYPVYWVLAVPLVLLWMINPGQIYAHPERHDLLPSLLLTPSRQLPIVSVGWTLVYELYFYGVASFLFYFEWRRRSIPIAAWFLLIAVSTALHPQPFENACLQVWLSPLTMEFIAGMVLAQVLKAERLRLSGGVAGAAILVATLAGVGAGLRHGQFNVFAPDLVRVLSYGLPACVVLGTVLQMEIQKKWNWSTKLVWLGDRSFSIYILHVPILDFIQFLTVRWLKPASSLEALWIFLTMTCLAVLPIEFFYRLVEVPSHALARRLAQCVHPDSRRFDFKYDSVRKEKRA